MLQRMLLAFAFFAAAATVPRVAHAQDNAVRFEIRSVGDSTFTFAAPQAPWVTKGQKGIAVDPRRRDGLVARFVVLGVDDGIANALILGQSQKVTTDHVVLMVRRVRRGGRRLRGREGVLAAQPFSQMRRARSFVTRSAVMRSRGLVYCAQNLCSTMIRYAPAGRSSGSLSGSVPVRARSLPNGWSV